MTDPMPRKDVELPPPKPLPINPPSARKEKP